MHATIGHLQYHYNYTGTMNLIGFDLWEIETFNFCGTN